MIHTTTTPESPFRKGTYVPIEATSTHAVWAMVTSWTVTVHNAADGGRWSTWSSLNVEDVAAVAAAIEARS